MSELARKKELCIKVIRSHLISSPTGLTLSQLKRDYEGSEREELPYRIFGFTDCMSFLKSLKDVVHVGYQSGQAILYGVADESSKHVKFLVDNQKRKPRLKPKRPEVVYYNPKNQLMSRSRKVVPLKHKIQPQVSAYVQQKIYKVVKNLKGSVSLSLFLDIYEKENGLPLNPKQQGFQSLAQLLQSIPDVCLLEFGRRDRNGNVLYISPRCLPKLSSDADAAKSREQCSDTLNLKNSLSTSPTSSSDSNDDPQPQETLVAQSTLDPGAKPKENPANRTEIENQQTTNSEPKTDDRQNLFELPVIPSCQLVKTEIIDLLKGHPKGVWTKGISSLYEKKYGKTLDILKLGYFSVIEFMSTLTDEISITRPQPKGDWIVCLRGNEGKLSAARSKTLSDEDIEITKMEIREIIIKAGNGIPLEKIGDFYERAYRHKMDVADYDMQAFTYLVLQIEGVKVYREKRELMVAMNEAHDVISRTVKSKVPSDAVGPNTAYRLPELPVVSKNYIDIYVADVTHPEFFSIQVKGMKTTGALDELMDLLENFYNSAEADQYVLPDDMVQPGQICAAVFVEDQNWHRVAIARPYTSDYVEVLYVDYGTLATVPRSSLRLLKSCFLNLPSQMIRARLSHLKPRNLTHWTVQARHAMLEMCRGRSLLGMVRAVENRVLSLCICDTSKPGVDVHVNDSLVEAKHAVYFPDGLSMEEENGLKEMYRKQFDAEEAGEVVDMDNTPLLFMQSRQSTSPKLVETENAMGRHRSDAVNLVATENATAGHVNGIGKLVETEDATAGHRHDAVKPVEAENSIPGHRNDTVNLVATANATAGYRNDAINETSNTHLEAKSNAIMSEIVANQNVKKYDYISDPETTTSTQIYVQVRTIANGMHTLHIINYEGKPMVTSFEISLLLGESTDLLRPLLLMKNLTYSEVIIGNNDKNKELFNSAYEHEVPGAMRNGVRKVMMCLYKLHDLPNILYHLGSEDKKQIISDATKIVHDFDMSANFWSSDHRSIASESGYLNKLENGRDLWTEERKEFLGKSMIESNSSTVSYSLDTITDMQRKVRQTFTKTEDTLSKVPMTAELLSKPGIEQEAVKNPYTMVVNQENLNFGDSIPKKYGPSTTENINVEGSVNVTDTSQATPHEEILSSDDFVTIPGAHIDHDIVEFAPEPINTTAPRCQSSLTAGTFHAVYDCQEKVDCSAQYSAPVTVDSLENTGPRSETILPRLAPDVTPPGFDLSGRSSSVLQNSSNGILYSSQNLNHVPLPHHTLSISRGSRLCRNANFQPPQSPIRQIIPPGFGNHAQELVVPINQPAPPPGFGRITQNIMMRSTLPTMTRLVGNSGSQIFQDSQGQIYLSPAGVGSCSVMQSTHLPSYHPALRTTQQQFT